MTITRRSLFRAATAVGLGGFAVPALAACNSASESTALRATWWGGSTRHELTQKVIELYRESHPEVAFDVSFSDFDSYYQKLNTEAAAGGLPDIIQLNGGFVVRYVDNDQLLDLTPSVEDGTLDISDFEDGQIAQGTVNSKLHALTLGGNMPAMMVNKGLLAEAGVEAPEVDITWTDFAVYVKELQTKLPDETFAVDHIDSATFTVWMRQWVDELFTADNTAVTFTQDQVEEYFAYWEDLRLAGANIPAEMVASELQNSAPAAAPFALRQAALVFRASNFLSQYQTIMDDELDIMRYPTGESKQGDWVQASQFFGIAATSQAPEAAVDFINFFTHDDDAIRLLGIERGVPASAAAREAVIPTLESYDALAVEFLGEAGPKTRPKAQLDPANIGEINNALHRAEEAISLGGVPISDASATFMEEIAKALDV